jgi:hypothetical protein
MLLQPCKGAPPGKGLLQVPAQLARALRVCAAGVRLLALAPAGSIDCRLQLRLTWSKNKQ